MRWKIHKPVYGWKHYRFVIWYGIRRSIKKLACGIAKKTGETCPNGYNTFCWKIIDCPILKNVKATTQFVSNLVRPIVTHIKRNGKMITYVSYADNVPRLDFHKIIFGDD